MISTKTPAPFSSRTANGALRQIGMTEAEEVSRSVAFKPRRVRCQWPGAKPPEESVIRQPVESHGPQRGGWEITKPQEGHGQGSHCPPTHAGGRFAPRIHSPVAGGLKSTLLGGKRSTDPLYANLAGVPNPLPPGPRAAQWRSGRGRPQKQFPVNKSNYLSIPPFPRPPIRPHACLRGLPPKANSWQPVTWHPWVF